MLLLFISWDANMFVLKEGRQVWSFMSVLRNNESVRGHNFLSKFSWKIEFSVINCDITPERTPLETCCFYYGDCFSEFRLHYVHAVQAAGCVRICFGIRPWFCQWYKETGRVCVGGNLINLLNSSDNIAESGAKHRKLALLENSEHSSVHMFRSVTEACQHSSVWFLNSACIGRELSCDGVSLQCVCCSHKSDMEEVGFTSASVDEVKQTDVLVGLTALANFHESYKPARSVDVKSLLFQTCKIQNVDRNVQMMWLPAGLPVRLYC